MYLSPKDSSLLLLTLISCALLVRSEGKHIQKDIKINIHCDADDQICNDNSQELQDEIKRFFFNSAKVNVVHTGKSSIEAPFMRHVKSMDFKFDSKQKLISVKNAFKKLFSKNVKGIKKMSEIVKIDEPSLNAIASEIANSAHRKVLLILTDNDSKASEIQKIVQDKTKASDILFLQFACKNTNTDLCNLYKFDVRNDGIAVFYIVPGQSIKKKIFPPSSEIKESDFDDIFPQETPKYAGKIVAYLASWCGHCKRFKPTLEEAQEKFQTEFSNFPIEAVFCDEPSNQEICASEGIRGYPTIRIYDQDDKFIRDFNEERSVENLRKAVKETIQASTSSGHLPIGQLISRVQFTAALENSDYHYRATLLALPQEYDHTESLKFLNSASEALSNSKKPSNIMFFTVGENPILDSHLKVQNIKKPVLLVVTKDTLRTIKNVNDEKIFKFIAEQNYSDLKSVQKPIDQLAPLSDNSLNLFVYTDLASTLNDLEKELSKHRSGFRLEYSNSMITVLDEEDNFYTFKNFNYFDISSSVNFFIENLEKEGFEDL